MKLPKSIVHRIAATTVIAMGLLAAGTLLVGSSRPSSVTAVARLADIRVVLSTTGVLRPAESITYRSPVLGRELEVMFLVAEGTSVRSGDLLVRLDATELQRDLDRATQTLRQAEMEFRVAAATSEGDITTDADSDPLAIEEATAKLKLAEKKLARLKQDRDGLEPLLTKGYITRDELDRATSELEESEVEVSLLKRRLEILTTQTRPLDQRRRNLLVVQREAQFESARQRRLDATRQVDGLREAIASTAIYARHAGLVIHEDLLNSMPKRRVHVGDRVTPSQGLVTIPEVDRMLLDTTVREVELWRLRIGQHADITVDAFPGNRLEGTVTSIGTLGRVAMDKQFDEKRFDVTIAIVSKAPELRPEMSAQAAITVAEHRGVLTVPIAAVFEHSNQRIVYVARRWGAENRPVRTGDNDGNQIQILDGLHLNERVLLSEPISNR